MLTFFRKLIPIDHPLRTLYHRIWGLFAAVKYGFPGKKIPYIGVTGTDGKTTTVFLIAQLLSLTGKKVGMTSTVGFRIGDQYWTNKSHKTSMGRFGLQSLLARFVREKCDIAVVECSSHGLYQGRLSGIDFSTAVVTNLSREHLDYHRTMEKYKEAKGLLCKIVEKSKLTRSLVVCNDFAEAPYFLSFSAENKITYGETKDSTLRLLSAKPLPKGQELTFLYEGSEYVSQTSLEGHFNALNILAALGVLLAQGASVETLIALIPALQSVPGRMEEVTNDSQPYRFFIDYAVTPEALHSLYSTLKPLGKRLVAILGACGDRDQGKRPEMGAIAAKLCDYVYLTDEEPYTEDPQSIVTMIESGVKTVPNARYEVQYDRASAIQKAVANAQGGDVIVISGMGDQTSRVVGNSKQSWSDREEVKKAMDKA